MSRPCPEPEELFRLLDGEVTENRAAALRVHLASCPSCGSELDAQRLLLGRLAAPPARGPSAAAAERILAQLDTPVPPARPVPRWRWALGGAAVAAAAALVIAAPWMGDPGFRARGGSAAWARKVGVDIWALEREGAPRRLASGSSTAPDVPLLASYRNLAGSPAWLLAFAVDARGEVHWLYPGAEPGSDPEAVRLGPAAGDQALPDAAVLEGVAEGPLRVIVVVSPRSLRVSSLGALGPATAIEALRARVPEAMVDEIPLTVRPLPAHPRRGTP
jgi:hypothetical protein